MDNFPKMTTALMEARRKAQLEGRPLSQEEAQGIAAGYFQQAGERSLSSRMMTTREDALKDERWKNTELMNRAGQASNNQLLGNLINTGGSLAMYKYLMGL